MLGQKRQLWRDKSDSYGASVGTQSKFDNLSKSFLTAVFASMYALPKLSFLILCRNGPDSFERQLGLEIFVE